MTEKQCRCVSHAKLCVFEPLNVLQHYRFWSLGFFRLQFLFLKLWELVKCIWWVRSLRKRTKITESARVVNKESMPRLWNMQAQKGVDVFERSKLNKPLLFPWALPSSTTWYALPMTFLFPEGCCCPPLLVACFLVLSLGFGWELATRARSLDQSQFIAEAAHAAVCVCEMLALAMVVQGRDQFIPH